VLLFRLQKSESNYGRFPTRFKAGARRNAVRTALVVEPRELRRLKKAACAISGSVLASREGLAAAYDGGE
jgi:hypothetical protein